MARILIVDDSLLIRTQLREILSQAGHDVVGEAPDGLLAPDLVRELHPSLVTLDLIMPGRNGLATLQHLLKIDSSLTVVVCSACLDQAKVIDALRLGASAFIVKPFDRLTVLDAIHAALAGARSSRRGVLERRLGDGLAVEHDCRVVYEDAEPCRAASSSLLPRPRS